MAKKKAARKAQPKGEKKGDGDPYEGWRDHRGQLTKGCPPGPGRPEGSLSLRSILRHELSKGKDARAKSVIRALIEAAESGDVAAARTLLEHTDGKPLQQTIMDITTHEPTIVVRKEKRK